MDELIKENAMLKEEINLLKMQLDKYMSPQKKYYEKNKEIIKEKAKQRTQQLVQDKSDKIKEYAKRAYLKKKEKQQAENI